MSLAIIEQTKTAGYIVFGEILFQAGIFCNVIGRTGCQGYNKSTENKYATGHCKNLGKGTGFAGNFRPAKAFYTGKSLSYEYKIFTLFTTHCSAWQQL